MAAYAPNPSFQPAGNFPHHLQQQTPSPPPPQQYQQHHQHHQQGIADDPNAPHRQSSFGLPSVKRTSTWASSIMKSIEGLADDKTDTAGMSQHLPATTASPSPGPGPGVDGGTVALAQPLVQQQFGVGPQAHQMTVGQGQGSFNHFFPNGQPHQQLVQQQQPQFTPGAYRPSQPTMQGYSQQYQPVLLPTPQQQQQQSTHPLSSQPFHSQGFQHPPLEQSPPQSFPGPHGQMPNGQPAMGQRGLIGPAGHSQIVTNGGARGQPWVPQGMRPDETVSPASGNPRHQLPPQGNPIQRYPPQGPQGPWKLEESHLTQPLLSTTRNRATSNSSQQAPTSYGYDKETGGSGPPSVQAQRTAPSEPQPRTAGPQTESPQAQARGVQASASQGPGGFPSRSFTSQTDDVSTTPTDQSSGRRVSNLFGGLRQKITGTGSDDRKDAAVGGARIGPPGGPVGPPGGPVGPPGGPVGLVSSFGGPMGSSGRAIGPAGGPVGPPPVPGVTGDGVSEASVATHDTAEQKKRNSFLPLRSPGKKPSDNDSIIVHSPGTPAPPPSPKLGPPDKKPTIFNSIASRTAKNSMSDVPRPSISGNAPPAANIPGQPPKKRFSALKDVFSRSSGQQDQAQQPPPPSAHSTRSSLQVQAQVSQPPFAPSMQPNLMGPPRTTGRDPSDKDAGSRPFPASPPRVGPQVMQLQAGAPVDSERGRKASAGGFLGFLKSRSDSKNRDTNPQQGVIMATADPQLPPQHPPGQQGQPQFRPQQPVGGQQPGQHLIQGQYLAQRSAPGQQPIIQGSYSVPRQGPGAQQPGQPLPQATLATQQQLQLQALGQQRPSQSFVPQTGLLQNQQQLSGQMVGQMPQGPGFSLQHQALPQQQLAPRTGPQLPPQSQHGIQQAQTSSGPATETFRQGSPQIGSPVSQNSQPAPLSPVDQVRHQNDSPVSFRQGQLPQQQSSPALSTQVFAPRQSLPGTTPPMPGQAPIRKPVPSSSTKAGEQLDSQRQMTTETQPGERAASFSSLQQSPKLGPQVPPAPAAVPEHGPGVSGHVPSSQSPPIGHIMQQSQLPVLGSQAQQHVSPVPTASAQATRQSPLAGPPQQAQGLGLLQGPPVHQLSQQAGQQAGPRLLRPVAEHPQLGASPTSGAPYTPPQPQFVLNRTATNQSGPLPGSQKEQSTMSKFFKGIASSQPSASVAQGQEKPDKEKKSFMSSILRSSKSSQPQQTPPTNGVGQFPQAHFVKGQFPQAPPPLLQSPQAQQGPAQAQGQLPQNQPGPQGLSGGSALPGQPTQPSLQQIQAHRVPSTAAHEGQAGSQPPLLQRQQTGSTVQAPIAAHPGVARAGPQHIPQTTPQPQQIRLQNLQRQVSGLDSRAPSGALEPQYDQVPIPQGYAYVHGEGRSVPSPYWAGRTPVYGPPPPGQFIPQQQQQQQQQWAPNGATMQQAPGLVQRQAQGGQPEPSQGMPLGQQVAHHQNNNAAKDVGTSPSSQSTMVSAPDQTLSFQHAQLSQAAPQPTRSSQGQEQLNIASRSPPVQAEFQVPSVRNMPEHLLQAQQPLQPAQFSPPSGLSPVTQTTLTPLSSPGQPPQQSVSPVSQSQSRPEPARVATDPSQYNVSPPPQLRHPASPHSYPLPNTAFSPINPAASQAPNPPLPGMTEPVLDQQSTNLAPQRQASAVSQLSMQPPPEAQVHAVHQPLVLPSGHVVGGRSPNASPSPQVTPDRAVSPELPVVLNGPAEHERTVSPPLASNSPQPSAIVERQPIQHTEENIYDATPRISAASPFPSDIPPRDLVTAPTVNNPAAPAEPTVQQKLAGSGEHMVVKSHPPVAQPEPQSAEQASRGSNGSVTPVKSTSADIFEEAKRKMLLREQEEKIPVFPTEPDMEAAAAHAAKKKDEEEQPQMSATSYPGQEWNPYGEGFDSWDD